MERLIGNRYLYQIIKEYKKATQPQEMNVNISFLSFGERVLGSKRIGIYDNFFEIGGDSILSIQIVSRAKQAGLQLTPKQLFEHQTIAELAQVVKEEQGVQAEQGIITGETILTPIQQRFFAQKSS